MKVYVVKHWCEAHVVGVFDTEEKANVAMLGLGKIKREYKVEELEMNKVKK